MLGGADLPELPTGPSELEAAVYRWIVRHGRTQVWDASEELGLTRAKMAEAIQLLLSRGLVTEMGGDTSRFQAANPELALMVAIAPLESVIRCYQAHADEVRLQYASLRHEYLEAMSRGSLAVEVIPGIGEVRAAINNAAVECRTEVIASQPGGNRDADALDEASRRDVEMLQRGVRMRVLYSHTARFNKASQAYARRMSALGAEYRTAHELFGRLITFDREVAFVPQRDGASGAVVIREPSIVAFLGDVFDMMWTHAQPYATAAADGLEAVSGDLDRTIANLLAAGMKDEAIARRLGLSLRSTRRHIANIMERLGARSRFQAGVLMSARGLLDVDADTTGQG
ncbi:LuxR C-terminal-related transcriptional regulator [Solwaraspora sp. WMMB335]|uniref:LuxR C-terminal-related transcriptional regulator n=1 Tax=Solwaraspora sp. WMMB335 TaxID=3404118 RepID=UPI003B9582A1